MRKLKLIVSRLPVQKRATYGQVVDELTKLNITTDLELHKCNVVNVCKQLDISKALLRAFRREISLMPISRVTFKSLVRLSTGNVRIDQILKGGILKGEIVEFCGDLCETSSFAMHVLRLFLLSYPSHKAHHVDTTGRFETKLMERILLESSIENPNGLLLRTDCSRTVGASDTIQLLEQIGALYSISKTPTGLVVLEDISALFYTDRTQVLHMIRTLRCLGRLGITVIIIREGNNRYEFGYKENKLESGIDLRVFFQQNRTIGNQCKILKIRK